MNVKSLISNFATAVAAQGVSLLLAVVQALLIPKILGVNEYGYWQLFLFYVGYVGFFHLGLNDGVYLIHGGESREQIDKKSINSQFVVGLCYQLAFAALVVAFAAMGSFGEEREFVITCTAVYVLIQNAALFFGYVFQAMNETKLFSYSRIIERLVFFVPLVWFLAHGEKSFAPYVYAYICSSLCQLAFCIWHARDFIASGLGPARGAVVDTFASIRVGIFLMLANIASTLILGVARFFIDATWGIETFGKLSFSISLVNFFLTFVTQASMVLFPALRQVSKGEMARFVFKARDFMSLFFPVVYLLYFPAAQLLGLWLPTYAASFKFLALLMPICVFDSKMNITCTTYFKVSRQERKLLLINGLTAACSAIGVLLAINLLDSVYAVIAAVVISIVGRSLFSEKEISREHGQTTGSISYAEIFLSIMFILTALLLPTVIAFMVYLVAYGAFLYAYRNEAVAALKSVKRVTR